MERLIWRVAYKLPGAQDQAEIVKYTKESANALAINIDELGGVAVVAEDTEHISDEINDDLVTVPVEGKTQLHWD